MMAAKKGNRYYMARTSNGRQKKFDSPSQLWDAFMEYVQFCEDNPWMKNDAVRSGEKVGKVIQIPTQRPLSQKGFSSYVGITYQGFANYGMLESHKDFFDVFTRITEIIETNQLEGAMVGAYNANIVARVQGLKEQTDHTTAGQPITNITVQYPADKSEIEKI